MIKFFCNDRFKKVYGEYFFYVIGEVKGIFYWGLEG